MLSSSTSQSLGISAEELVGLPASRAKKTSPLLGGMIILIFGLVPLYLFSSGRPQIVDVLILILLGITLFFRHEKDYYLSNQIIPLVPFVIWGVLINSGYYLFYPSEYGLLLKNAEIIYTFVLLYGFTFLFKRIINAGSINVIYLGLILAIILCLTIKGNYEEGVRSALSFNNPNQLGYFSVILVCYAVLLIQYNIKHGGKLRYHIGDVIIILGGHIFALLSLSRGAILAIFLLDAWVITKIKNKAIIITVSLLAIISIALSIFVDPTFIERKLEGRAGRSFDVSEAQMETGGRILQNLSTLSGVQYIIGMSASLAIREKGAFGGVKGMGEVHNIFGDIFRCYGFIGLALFAYWILKVIWASRILMGGLWVWAAILMYNMSHNGVRFRSFWLLTALMIAMVELANREEKQNQEVRGTPAAAANLITSVPPER